MKYGTGFRNVLMKKRIFSFVRESLDGNEIAESTFWERLRTLEIEGEIVNKPSKKGNSFFLPKSNSYASINSSDISYSQLPSSTPSCPQDFAHDLSIISKEIEALDKVMNQSLQCITRDPSKECVSIETQTGDVSSVEYVDSEVGTNDDLFVTVANKGTETDSNCHQLIGTFRETISLLKDELRNKYVTIDNLIDVIKNFTVIENKYTRNKEHETNVGSKEKNDVVGELLEIDQLHHRFKKLADQPQSSTDTHTTCINGNKDCIEQNRDDLELKNNMIDNIIDQINESIKSSITTNRDRSDNDNNSPSDIYDNIVIFGDSITKGLNIRNLNA